MLTDSLKERLFARYQFLFDALDQVRAGKRFNDVEEAALQARYSSVAQEVLAKKAEDHELELLASAMLLARVLRPDVEAVEIVKVTQVPKVKLRSGFEAAFLQFVEPPRPQWSKQNCEFLRTFPTGLATV